ncbi:ESPR-type extended signal peptide-containing protein [Trinickia violacea]|uniref:ESPR-type extended signal peptide-containing protein n=1 Tax=Trinickia violacea TaxID=2571746 RepID=UPI0015862486|nr:ESPR-type extended signal peptide-containing protein [Trinickia violacea]
MSRSATVVQGIVIVGLNCMNAVFRSIWSEALGMWVAVSELPASRGKTGNSQTLLAPRQSDEHCSIGVTAGEASRGYEVGVRTQGALFSRPIVTTILLAFGNLSPIFAHAQYSAGGGVANGGSSIAIGTGAVATPAPGGSFGNVGTAIGPGAVAYGHDTVALDAQVGAAPVVAATAPGQQQFVNTTAPNAIGIGASIGQGSGAGLVESSSQEAIGIGSSMGYSANGGQGAADHSILIGTFAQGGTADAAGSVGGSSSSVALGHYITIGAASVGGAGSGNKASAFQAVLMGSESNLGSAAYAQFGLASNSSVTADNSVLIGASSQLGFVNNSNETVSAQNAVLIGSGSRLGVDANANNSILIGTGSSVGVSGANALNSVAIGSGETVNASSSIAIGTGNVVSGNNSGAIGDPTTITGSGTYTLGNNNGAVGANESGIFGNNNTLPTGSDNSRIVGNANTVNAPDSFVLGNNVTVNNANNVVLGNNSADKVAVQISSAAIPSVIATLNPDGTTSYAAGPAITYGNFAGTATGVVSVGAPGAERQIVNVAPGAINATSTDAVNGSQLYAVASQISALGGNVTTIVDNAQTHYYSVNDGGTQSANYNNAGASGIDALAAGTGASAAGANATAVGNAAAASATNSLAVGSKASATVANSVALGSGSTTTAATATSGTTIRGQSYTFAGATPTGVVSVGSVGADRQVQNVAAGQLTATSTDAVNGSQLYATNQAIDSLSNTVTATATHYYSVNDGGAQQSNYEGGGASGANSVAIGPGASASGASTVALGQNAAAAGQNATAIGANASATANNAVAMGANAVANGANSVAIGAGSVATQANTVSVGSTGNERRITNVAAGTNPTDAVNVSQLNAAASQNLYSAQRYTDRGVAAALAIPSVPMLSVGDKWIGAAAGTYGNATALGVAIAYQATPNLNVAGGVSSAIGGSTALKVQAGYRW